MPSPEAVRLLDDFLAEMTLGLAIPVILIAGNHDSPSRLGFGSRLFSQAGVHVHGRLQAECKPVTLGDRWGPVHFFALPYAEPAAVCDATGETDLHTHDQAMSHLAAAARAQLRQGDRSVCIAHCFVGGGQGCESERPLSVGGSEAVSPACFAGFTYTALGHLHRPQPIGERVRYSGSLMKYSFSEIPHDKSVTLVSLSAHGELELSEQRLQPRRELRMIEGELVDLLKGPARGESPEDFLLVRLTDRMALLDPMGRLREVYPNVLHIERPALERAASTALQARQPGQGDQELFAAFFAEVTGEPLTPPESAAFAAVYDQLRTTEREEAA